MKRSTFFLAACLCAFLFCLAGAVPAQYEYAVPSGYAEGDAEWYSGSEYPASAGYSAQWSTQSYQTDTAGYAQTDGWGGYGSGEAWGGSAWEEAWGSDPSFEKPWTPQLLPKGILYPSYLAGRKEPRLQSLFTHDSDYGWLWDITLGGRVPLFRYGTDDPIEPEGFQIDMEGAALLRLDIERDRELAGTDYRAGLPITYGTKHWQFKTGYYHVSSHLGDNYLLDHFRPKVHYVRDELILGVAFKPVSAVRLYGEAGWAFNAGETTSPWEFQFGAEYSPVYQADRAWSGTPFAAVCGHLFEELDFGGYFNSQIGWQWRSASNSRFRLGAEFYCGCDDQFQFHRVHQKKLGLGFWYDF